MPERDDLIPVVQHARDDMSNTISGRIQPPQQEGTLREMLGSIKDGLQEGWDNLRIGDGHVAGMIRLGAHEWTQALAAFPDSNIRPMEEPGVWGNPTQMIVTDQMDHDGHLSNYANRAPAIEAPGMER